MDTTLLCAPVEKWRAGETVWDGFMAPLYVVFLVRKLKSLGLVVDGIPASFCGLQGFAAVCQRPFHRLHKWKQSLCLFLSMVCITAQRDYGFLVCKQLSKIMTQARNQGGCTGCVRTSPQAPKVRILILNIQVKACSRLN